MTPAALFVCKASPYWSLLGPHLCWDADRDARTFAGDMPVITHPPCRGWGRFRHLAKVRPGERELAFLALDLVRRNGGVLEHPLSSQFWRAAGIHPDGLPDPWGGWAMPIQQCDFGHRAEKATVLYFVGVDRWPKMPPPRSAVTTVENLCRQERERTPPDLARWLVSLF
ncbi:MAG: hypothetical protein [Arizlama microvirus]|nr:MAG: hypothetical protein [Arizlama microvirus]